MPNSSLPPPDPSPRASAAPAQAQGGTASDLAGQVYREAYRHLPVSVVHMTLDGVVLHCNPEAARVTGYTEEELVGKNFWALLFPGRLFAQVPRFMSLSDPVQSFARDIPMTLRNRDGQDVVIAWTRHVGNGLALGLPQTLLCMGVDLTDRLLRSDGEAQGAAHRGGEAEGREHPGFGVGIGNGGTVDGEIIAPIAITPPSLPGNGAIAIAQVHEFLTEVSARVVALQEAFSRGEMEQLAGIAQRLQEGAYACGLLDFSARAERLYVAAEKQVLDDVTVLVRDITKMCVPPSARPPASPHGEQAA